MRHTKFEHIVVLHFIELNLIFFAITHSQTMVHS